MDCVYMRCVVLEAIGLWTFTALLCWLLHKTTNIAYLIGLSDKDKNDTHI